MPILSDYARKAKVRTFFHGDPAIPADARILEIGCGDGWLGRTLRAGGWTRYAGLDLAPPADIVGDIRDWRALGLEPGSFDVIAAFEVVEHVPCFAECHALLRPGGLMMLTSPIPERDWVCAALERAGLNQRRSGPHDHLIDFRNIPMFQPVWIRRVGFLAQWGLFRKYVEP